MQSSYRAGETEQKAPAAQMCLPDFDPPGAHVRLKREAAQQSCPMTYSVHLCHSHPSCMHTYSSKEQLEIKMLNCITCNKTWNA